jgi:putative adhesin
MRRHVGIVLLTSLAVVAGARAAAAQDPTIRIVVDPDVTRQVHRIVSQVIGADISRDVQRIVRDAIRSDIGREIGAAVREALADLPRTGVRMGRDFAWITSDQRVFRVEQTASETRTFQIGANGLLDLRNISGEITITAGSGRDATIAILRKSRGRTDADAKLGLDRVTVNADHRGDRVSVESAYPTMRNAPYSVSVNYTITAPAGTRLTISNLSGTVSIKGIKGDVSLDVASGDVNLTNTGAIPSAKTLSGDITLTGGDTNGTIDVGTLSGTITIQQTKARQIKASVTSGDVVVRENTVDEMSVGSLSGSVEFIGPLSKGGRYDVHGQSGDIRVTITNAIGFQLQAGTFSGQVRIDPSLGIQATGNGRREIRGTVGDGSAVVNVRAFSGNVTLTRK